MTNYWRKTGIRYRFSSLAHCAQKQSRRLWFIDENSPKNRNSSYDNFGNGKLKFFSFDSVSPHGTWPLWLSSLVSDSAAIDHTSRDKLSRAFRVCDGEGKKARTLPTFRFYYSSCRTFFSTRLLQSRHSQGGHVTECKQISWSRLSWLHRRSRYFL